VDAAGTVLATAPQVSIPTTDVGDRAAVLQSITVTCTVTNTYRVATISISGPAVNVVGEPHVFTVTVLQAGGTQPVVGIVPALVFVPEGTFTEGRDYTITNGCATGTNAAGQCTVTVQATAPGVIAIQGQGLPAPFDVTFDPPPASQKRFRAYQVTGSASDINLAGQDHTFTLSGIQFAATDAGGAPTGQGPLQADSVIRFTWTGPNPPTGPTVTALGGQQYQCVVDITGTCAVTVTSAVAATGVLTVTGISVFLDRGTGTATESIVNYGMPALLGPAPVLTKTWVSINVTATPTVSVNLIRQSHTFRFTATMTVGAAAPAPAAGGTLTYTWQTTSPDLIANPPTSCTLDANGQCDVVVTSAVLGTGSILVTGVTDLPVDDGVTQATLSVTTADPWAAASLSIPAVPPTKTWVGFTVALSPTAANNFAGDAHVITVQVSAFGGPAGPSPGPALIVGAKVDATVVAGSATLNPTASTCLTGGSDTVGQCTLVYDRTGPGTATIQLVDLRDVTIAGQLFGTVQLFEPGGGVAPGMQFNLLPADVQAAKTWWATRVRLDGDSTNVIGESHTFTATVEESPDGVSWQPVPDGSTLTHTWTVQPAGAAVVDSDTCAAPGTVGGVCHLTVSAAQAAIGTLTITGARIFLDRNGDGVFGRDVNDDGTITPDEYGDELVTVPSTAFTDSSVTAVKEWVPPGTRRLAVTKVDDVPSGSAVTAGGTFSYLITVANTGVVPLDAVTVSDTLPAVLTLLSVTPGAGWACPDAPVGTAGAAIHCEHAAPIVPDEESPAVTVTVRLAASYTGTSIHNVTTALAPGPPPIEAQATRDTPARPAAAPPPPARELPATGRSLPPVGLAFLLIISGLALVWLSGYRRPDPLA
jgi:uncharacterized repeat protein (TIGR01451 family)